MKNNNWLEFECQIMDMAELESIKTADELEKFADQLHMHLESALEDYAYDNGFGDDYEPLY